jgi:phenylalanyl-tRNA synthetase alpha chain
MKDKIQEVQQQIDAFTIENATQLEQFRIAYVGRKGVIADLFEGLKTVPAEDKRAMGAELNNLKNFAQNKFNEFAALLENQQLECKSQSTS